MKFITRAMVAATAASLAVTSVAKADGVNLFAYQSPNVFSASGPIGDPVTVTVTFLHSIAALDNQLRLFATVGGSSTLLINVASMIPSQGNPTPASFSFGTTGGTSLLFGICSTAPNGTPNVLGCPTGYTAWYSGPGANNVDGLVHAAILPAGTAVAPGTYNFERAGAGNPGLAAPAGSMVMGFEDRFNAGDGDFSDVVFSFENVTTTVPEPGTMGLLALGLVGLSGAGLVRRRRSANRNS